MKYRKIFRKINILCCSFVTLLLPLSGEVLANPLAEDKDITIKGNHPFRDGLNAWYLGLDTALAGHVYIGDVLDENLKLHDFMGQPMKLHSPKDEKSQDYENLHNHYQNLFVQSINKVPNLNAVSIWGDSTSVVDGAKSWGGFFSARSACHSYAKDGPLAKYGTTVNKADCANIDNQLIGIEIDVLNGSKPGVFPNMSKTGLQVVGFGNPNSMAIEVRSEDTDRLDNDKPPKGAFESGIYFKNSIQPSYGRLVVADFEKSKMGLDFRKPIFSEGVMSFNSQGVGTGIIVNNGDSGEIYGGLRWPNFDDPKGWLSLRLGSGGVRFVSNDNSKEVLAVDNYGGIYLNGDVYVNGQKTSLSSLDSQPVQGFNPWMSKRAWAFAVFVLFVNLLATVLLHIYLNRQRDKRSR